MSVCKYKDESEVEPDPIRVKVGGFRKGEYDEKRRAHLGTHDREKRGTIQLRSMGSNALSLRRDKTTRILHASLRRWLD